MNNLNQWDETKIIESTDANVLKYVFEKQDAVAEAVLYKYPTYEKRTVICCSTQSGCPVGCRFCGAGDNFVRSLTAEEIVSQPVQLLMDVWRKTKVLPSDMERLQIMFMSMGEPLLNIKNLVLALKELYERFPNAALLISTIGPQVDFSAVHKISEEIPTIGLQFSIHESSDERRNKLIPFKNKMSLCEIAYTGEEFYRRTGRMPFFNYCAHDRNKHDEDADKLVRLFSPNIWQATISVICERDENVAAANERQLKLATDFQQKLIDRGYKTRTFNPAGQDDIGGGCGQLWFVQDWMKKNKELARPSVGHDLPMIHTPR